MDRRCSGFAIKRLRFFLLLPHLFRRVVRAGVNLCQTCDAGARGSASLPGYPERAGARPGARPYLLAPTIHDGVCHSISDRFVAHRPLKLVNPVLVLLFKFALHCIGNSRRRNRTFHS